MQYLWGIRLQFTALTLTTFFCIRFMYALILPERLKLFVLFCLIGLGLTLWFWLRPFIAFIYLNLFYIAAFVEIVRTLSVAWNKKRAVQLKGSWMILLGMIPFSLTGAYWFLIALGVAPEPWAFEDFPTPFYAILILMISMSVFLARNFAQTNRNLEAQLVKVSAIEREVRRTRDVFRLFVPDAVLDRIAKQGLESIKLGGAEERIATILFTDIRSFTTIAEKLSPNDTLAFLNEFMQRMESAIIGDTVNLASRLQNLTRNYGVGVLVSESAFREISSPEKFCYREIDVVQVRGKTQPVVIYETFDADPEHIKTQKFNCLSQYNRGLHYFHAEDWQQARPLQRAHARRIPKRELRSPAPLSARSAD